MTEPKGAILDQMIRAAAGTRLSAKFSWGAGLLFLLAYFFAVPPALAIERFIDAQGIIHISNAPAPKQNRPEMAQASPLPGLPSPLQAGGPPDSHPKQVLSGQAPKIDPPPPMAQKAPEATPVTPSAASPLAASSQAAAPPHARLEIEKPPAAAGALAGADQAPKPDAPGARPETATSGVTPVPENKALPCPERVDPKVTLVAIKYGSGPRSDTAAPRVTGDLQNETESGPDEMAPDGTLATVTRNSISCSWSWGVLRITNVAVTEPNELAWRQSPGPQPGRSPEACSEYAPEIQTIVLSEEAWEDPQARPAAGRLAESNPVGREVPSIRVYRGPGGVIHLENADAAEQPVTVST